MVSCCMVKKYTLRSLCRETVKARYDACWLTAMCGTRSPTARRKLCVAGIAADDYRRSECIMRYSTIIFHGSASVVQYNSVQFPKVPFKFGADSLGLPKLWAHQMVGRPSRPTIAIDAAAQLHGYYCNCRFTICLVSVISGQIYLFWKLQEHIMAIK